MRRLIRLTFAKSRAFWLYLDFIFTNSNLFKTSLLINFSIDFSKNCINFYLIFYKQHKYFVVTFKKSKNRWI